MEKEFKDTFDSLKPNLPKGTFSERFTEQLCYRFYLLGRKSSKTKKVSQKESLKIIKKL